jgi:hypothetical protein
MIEDLHHRATIRRLVKEGPANSNKEVTTTASDAVDGSSTGT